MLEAVMLSGPSCPTVLPTQHSPTKGKNSVGWLLVMQVQQRDNEINILVSMLKKREDGRAPGLVAPATINAPPAAGAVQAAPAATSSEAPPLQTLAASRNAGKTIYMSRCAWT